MQHEETINKLLWSFGVNKRYLGFNQMAYGLILSMLDKGRLEHITKDIYPDIAKKFGTSIECVERNIRTLEGIIWEYGDREWLQELGKINMDAKPTSTRFFEILTEYLLSAVEETNEETGE